MLETIEPLIKSWLDGVVKESILQPYVAVVVCVGGRSAVGLRQLVFHPARC